MFEKGKHLFGLDKASNAIRKDDRAVVVEGYFDVIALHAAGITNAVASLGTALSSQQITQLCRVSDSKRIVLNFDADGAGVRAANRAIGEVEQLAMQGQLELRVLHLPSGKDPDEFLKQNGAGDYRALLDQAPSGWIGRSSRCWRSAISAGPTSSNRRLRPWWGCWANCPSPPCAPITCSGWRSASVVAKVG